MKLLIFTCLMAVALARPTFPLRHPALIPNEPDSTKPVPREFRKEHINELNRSELLREKQNEELKQKIPSSSSSSEEVVSTSIEQKHIPREDVINQRYLEQMNKYNELQLEAVQDQKYIPTQNWFYYPYLEQLPRKNEFNHIQLREPIVNQEQAYFYVEPFQELAAYPYAAAWYYLPQIMQYMPSSPFYGSTQPIASGNTEKTYATVVRN